MPGSIETASNVKLNDTESKSTASAVKTSRKGKKAWRKNVDLKGIEESLDQVREEQRLMYEPSLFDFNSIRH